MHLAVRAPRRPRERRLVHEAAYVVVALEVRYALLEFARVEVRLDVRHLDVGERRVKLGRVHLQSDIYNMHRYLIHSI